MTLVFTFAIAAVIGQGVPPNCVAPIEAASRVDTMRASDRVHFET